MSSLKNQQTMGSHFARTIDVTHDIERRPTTTETRVAYDNYSTCHAMNATYINSTKDTSSLLKAYLNSLVNRTGSPQGGEERQSSLFVCLFVCLLKANSPAKRTGSPQGFYKTRTLHKHLKHTNIIRTLVPSVLLS